MKLISVVFPQENHYLEEEKSACKDKLVNTIGKEEGWDLFGIIIIVRCFGAGLPLPLLCSTCSSALK